MFNQIVIKIHKDFRNYKAKVLANLTFRQLLSLSIALTFAIPMYILLKEKIGSDLLSWLIIFSVIPILGVGFYEVKGLTFEQIIKRQFKFNFLNTKKRTYKTNPTLRRLVKQNKKDDWKTRRTPFYFLNKKSKNSYQNVLEKTILLQKSLEAGDYEKALFHDFENELLTVRSGIGLGNKERKKKKSEKDGAVMSILSKVKKIFSKDFVELELKATEIKLKRDNHAYYVLNKKERRILKKYTDLLEKRRLKSSEADRIDIQSNNKSMVKRRKLKSTLPKSTQDTIPYIADFEEGMFEITSGTYSKSYTFTDVNYSAAKTDEKVSIFSVYCELLNYFPSDMKFTISIDNRIVTLEEQKKKVFCPLQNNDFDMHVMEYNKILGQNLSEGRNNINKDKIITVVIKEDSPMEALLKFRALDKELAKHFRSMGSLCLPMDTNQKLEVLHDKFRIDNRGNFIINHEFLKEQGLNSKDYIAPSSFSFKKKYFMIEDQYCQCLYLSNILPNTLKDNFISEMTSMNFPLLSTFHIEPVQEEEAVKSVKNQLSLLNAEKLKKEKSARDAGFSTAVIGTDLATAINECHELLNALEEQKYFFVTFVFMLQAKSAIELKNNKEKLDRVARKYYCQTMTFDDQQEEAFKVALPMGFSPEDIAVDRGLTTQNLAIFMPFENVDLFQAGGFYYGINAIKRNLILFHRIRMKTPSGFILGSSGSGKSFATKREILNVLLTNDKSNLIVIDPENEYGDFAIAFGGLVLHISSNSEHRINLMDMGENYGLTEKDNPLKTPLEVKKKKALTKKVDFIMSVVQAGLGSDTETVSVTPKQKSTINNAVRACYETYLEHDFDMAYIPTLTDLQNEFVKAKETNQDSADLADSFEFYVNGGMESFSQHSNVDFNNRFVVFCIRELENQIKNMGILVILDFIWNRLVTNANLKIRTYVYVDEIHVLLLNLYAVVMLLQLFKRGRKYGLVITGITQNVSDVLESKTARKMISNSEFVLMLNQAKDDLKTLGEILDISESQKSYIDKSESGNGLLYAEGTLVPFEDNFPNTSYLYKLMSTDFNEETIDPVSIVEEARREYERQFNDALQIEKVSA